MPRPRIEQDDELPPRKRQPVAEEVSDEMSRTDLIHLLQHINFVSGHRGVRDYLVRALRPVNFERRPS